MSNTIQYNVDQDGIALLTIDLPVMVGLAVLCWLLPLRSGRYRVRHGVLFLAVYAAYLIVVAFTASDPQPF